MRLVILMLTLLFYGLCYSLNLSDFMPSFLGESQVNKNPSSKSKAIPASPSIIYGKTNRQKKCVDPTSSVPNMFCMIEPNGHDSESGVANNTKSSDIYNGVDLPLYYAIPDANQSALHTPAPVTKSDSPSQSLINNLSLPIQTSKDVNVNITTQQIELNIKY